MTLTYSNKKAANATNVNGPIGTNESDFPTDLVQGKAALVALPKAHKTAPVAKPSPWLDPKRQNWFRYQVELAIEKSDMPGFKPFPAYVWINRNGGTQLLFKALTKFAPLFPVAGYCDKVCSWASPPPWGSRNVVCLVFGKDITGRLRLVGGNRFTTPRRTESLRLSASEFFTQYDSSAPDKQNHLVFETVCRSMTRADADDASRWELACEAFHAMPIYITVLTGNASLFAVGPASVEGDRPADYSFESFGEISK